MLIITYDEHGGFYDHVNPFLFRDKAKPVSGIDHYGVRVPTSNAYTVTLVFAGSGTFQVSVNGANPGPSFNVTGGTGLTPHRTVGALTVKCTPVNSTQKCQTSQILSLVPPTS